MASLYQKYEDIVFGLLPQEKTSSFLARASQKETVSSNKRKEGECCSFLGPALNFGMNIQNEEKSFLPTFDALYQNSP